LAQVDELAQAVRIRRVARVLTLDPHDRVLLFDTALSYTHVWMTPGGALNDGERYRAAVRRELWEETGLRPVSVSPCVWTVRFRFLSTAGVLYDQRERYYLARVDSAALTGDHREAAEQIEIRGHRWWNVGDIARSRASFRPDGLGRLLPPVIAGRYPPSPVRAQVESGARVIRESGPAG
jgi:ADP-ribose pyrophosphatase YjhB (NUDIX family)